MRKLVLGVLALGAFCNPSGLLAQEFAAPLGMRHLSLPEAKNEKYREKREQQRKGRRTYSFKDCEKIQSKWGRYHDKSLECWAKSINAQPLQTGEAWYHFGLQHERGMIENASIENAVYLYEISSGVIQGKRCKNATEKGINYIGEEICLLYRSHGYPASQLQLGLLYAHGKLVERDLEAARFWFEAAKYRRLKIAEQALVALDDLEKRIAAMKEKDTDTEK